MGELIGDLWPYLFSLATLLLDLFASCHAVLHKRDTRAAIAWVGFIWFVPLVGSLLYFLLGINRIQRRAQLLRGGRPRLFTSEADRDLSEAPVDSVLPGHPQLKTLAKLVGDVTQRPLLAGNRIAPLRSDAAFLAMLNGIENAERSVTLTTYIFDNDRAGKLTLDALTRAMARGVAVRVIIDDVGARYTWPSIVGPLRRSGVPFARFLPRFLPRAFPHANLRNHRKILVIDGRCAFTGGMNIREGHCPSLNPKHPIDDLLFQIDGPIVAQLQEVFADDWSFCKGEHLAGEPWFFPLDAAGSALARVIPDGPDEDFEKLRLTLLGALACAQYSLTLVTPYFLPDASLITALNVAALRGVAVDIVLPAKNNLILVQWASTALLWQVLERGCRVWLTPPPFDHTKLLIVDRSWSLFGSANWDPRSLRLNFELSVECYDPDLACSLDSLVQAKIQRARLITLADVDGRPLLIRLRDGGARLFSPYL